MLGISGNGDKDSAILLFYVKNDSRKVPKEYEIFCGWNGVGVHKVGIFCILGVQYSVFSVTS